MRRFTWEIALAKIFRRTQTAVRASYDWSHWSRNGGFWSARVRSAAGCSWTGLCLRREYEGYQSMSEMNSLRFTVAADGTSLAYQSTGRSVDASAPLLFTNGFATSSFYWEPLLGRLANRGQLVTWDLKGHGRSAPARDMRAVGVPSCADDLRRVMDAAGIEKATLLGFSFGCQIVLEAWRQFPDRINAIVPILGPFGRPFDNLVDPRLGKLAYRAFSMAGSRGAGAMLRTGFYGSRLPGTHRLVKRLGIVCDTVDSSAMQPFYKHLGAID